MEKCAACRHRYEEHYERYDGKLGCSYVDYSLDMFKVQGRCECEGYAVRMGKQGVGTTRFTNIDR